MSFIYRSNLKGKLSRKRHISHNQALTPSHKNSMNSNQIQISIWLLWFYNIFIGKSSFQKKFIDKSIKLIDEKPNDSIDDYELSETNIDNTWFKDELQLDIAQASK